MDVTDTMAFLEDNFSLADMDFRRGSIEDAISGGNPFIAIVHGGDLTPGHAVVVDGVEDVGGVPHVIVRDPAEGAYLQEVDFFVEQRVVRDPEVFGPPAIWGVRKSQ